ncbi:MAG: phage adsorption protein NrfB [Acidobacteria bacterium]|nr:phage adsorption protein NrfB [Acidobacteriota bacterium]
MGCTPAVDAIVIQLMVPLACWIVLSGLDDLFLDALFLFKRFFNNKLEADPPPSTTAGPHPRIAIFLPLWQESEVVASALEHNISVIRYRDYAIFAGAYPNDEATGAEIRRVAARHPHVHLAMVPHPGPTSKADCLNAVHQAMLAHEQESGERFDIVLLHDAEDLIHPDSLHWIGHASASYDMVQVPVLPIKTPWYELTHGVYCDEFAESTLKDLPLRQALGGFVPSCGVGTGLTRKALGALEAAYGAIFEPVCLTEDYEIGFKIKDLGLPQVFLPLTFTGGAPMATREYFPRNLAFSIRQKSRWITGIALQGWQRHGWRTTWRQRFWFWRDRKGLAGNLLTMAANSAFLYGLSTWMQSLWQGSPWCLGQTTLQHPVLGWLLAAAALPQIPRIGIRILCTSSIYGLGFGLLAPVRVVWANWVNFRATFRALWQFALARLGMRKLAWSKTSHAYPTRGALARHKRNLSDLLVERGDIEVRVLRETLEDMPAFDRLGDYLVRKGILSEDQLYSALAAQQGVEWGRLSPDEVDRGLARTLPLRMIRDWSVLPYKLDGRRLYVASADLPSDELQEVVRSTTGLDVQFRLVPPLNLEELKRVLL